MRRALVISISLAATYGVVHVIGACLDVTPIIVEKDAFDPDAACLSCLQGKTTDNGGCTDLITSCEGDHICKPTYECMVAIGCFDLRTIDDKIKCGLNCAQDAGLTNIDDPTTAYLVNFLTCARDKCTEVCNLVDANVGF